MPAELQISFVDGGYCEVGWRAALAQGKLDILRGPVVAGRGFANLIVRVNLYINGCFRKVPWYGPLDGGQSAAVSLELGDGSFANLIRGVGTSVVKTNDDVCHGTTVTVVNTCLYGDGCARLWFRWVERNLASANGKVRIGAIVDGHFLGCDVVVTIGALRR